MKAVQKVNTGVGIQIRDLPLPQPAEDQVLIKVKAAGLCKSDIDVYEWTPLVAAADYPKPFTLGHEFAGEVIEVGSQVKNFRVGDHVAGETHVSCNGCYACKTGKAHICPQMGNLGRTVNGCFAEYLVLPEKAAVKINSELPYAYGALMEPLGVAVHALTKGDISGKKIAIMGCGTIGLMTVELAKILGAIQVFAVSRTEKKLQLAAEYGADRTYNSEEEDPFFKIMKETEGQGVDLVIDYTGNNTVINRSLDILRIAGNLILVGLIDYPLTIDKFTERVVFKELNITGIFGRRMFETWELLKDIMDQGLLNLDNYIGAELSMLEFEKGVKLFTDTIGRIIFYPEGER